MWKWVSECEVERVGMCKSMVKVLDGFKSGNRGQNTCLGGKWKSERMMRSETAKKQGISTRAVKGGGDVETEAVDSFLGLHKLGSELPSHHKQGICCPNTEEIIHMSRVRSHLLGECRCIHFLPTHTHSIDHTIDDDMIIIYIVCAHLRGEMG